MNLLRARRALGGMKAGAVLEILLGEEGRETVPDGVRALGHEVLGSEEVPAGLRLRVRASGAGDQVQLDDETLRRYARQIVLPEFGERGQVRLQRAHVMLLGEGPALDTARLYLLAGGVGGVSVPSLEGGEGHDASATLVAWAGAALVPEPWRLGAPDALVLAQEGTGCRVQTGWENARELDTASDALARAFGTLLADAVQRHIVLDSAPEGSLQLPLAQA